MLLPCPAAATALAARPSHSHGACLRLLLARLARPAIAQQPARHGPPLGLGRALRVADQPLVLRRQLGDALRDAYAPFNEQLYAMLDDEHSKGLVPPSEATFSPFDVEAAVDCADQERGLGMLSLDALHAHFYRHRRRAPTDDEIALLLGAGNSSSTSSSGAGGPMGGGVSDVERPRARVALGVLAGGTCTRVVVRAGGLTAL